MTSDSDESYDPHARMHESFPRVDSGSTQMAGDVLPMPGDRTLGSSSTQMGVDANAANYATGTKTEPKVLSIGAKTLTGWANRTSTRIDGR